MWDTRLRAQLESVAYRYRRYEVLTKIAPIWAIATIVALLLLGLSYVTGLWLGWLAPIVLAGGGIAAYRRWMRERRRPADWTQLGRLVERSYPELNSLLITAIEQEGGAEGKPLLPLQQEVVRHAYYESKKRSWEGAISDARLWGASFLHWGGFALLLVSLWGLAVREPSGVSPLASGRLVEVLPGNTGIEAGGSISIIARFRGDNLPAEPKVVMEGSGEGRREMGLTKSLSDPVFSATLSEVNKPLEYRIVYGDKESRTYHVNVYTIPAVEQADARLVYPAFTGKSPRTVRDTRHVTAVEGSKLRMFVHVNKPLKSAVLIADKERGQSIPLRSSHGRVYEAEWTLEESRRFRVKLADEVGRTNTPATSIEVKVLRNRRPQMALEFPPGDRQVSPLEELRFEGKVADDFGLKGYGLAFSRPGEETRYIELGGEAKGREERRLEYLLALEELQVQPDDVINYFLWAEDLGPDGELRRSMGEIFFAEVRPFEEIFQEGPSAAGGSRSGNQGGRQGGSVQRVLELQKKVINVTWNVMRESRDLPEEQAREDISVVRKSQQEVVEGVNALTGGARGASSQEAKRTMEAAQSALGPLQDARTDPENRADLLSEAIRSEQEAYRGLLKLQSQEHVVARGSQGGGGGGSSGAQGRRQLDALELRQSENLYETERQASSSTSPESEGEQARQEVIDALDALAERQRDLNDQLQRLQTALQEAETEEEREEARRRLERLREEERKALEELDQIRQRLAQEGSPESAKAQARLEQTRSRVEQAAQELKKGAVSQALASGTRAQRELEQTRESLRQTASSQFEEALQEMRRKARSLVESEEGIRKRLDAASQGEARRLSGGPRQEAREQLRNQERKVGELLEQIRKTSQAAEAAEPLLSDRLYEALRGANQAEGAKQVLRWDLWDAWRDPDKGSLENSLLLSGELLEKGLTSMADQVEEKAYQALVDLAEKIDEAAEAVLGSEEEAMRLARNQVDSLVDQLEQEIEQESGRRSASEASNTGAEQRTGESGERRDARTTAERVERSGGSDKSQRPETSQASAESQAAEGARASTSLGSARRTPPDSSLAENENGDGGGGTSEIPTQAPSLEDFKARMEEELARMEARADQPITGGGFQEWSNRLRDVRQMLNDETLRQQAGAVLNAARGIRSELNQRTAAPQWQQIRTEVLNPLVELRNRLSEELARRGDPGQLPPLGRDPVPEEYSDLVRVYYERLGSETAKE